MPDNMNIWIMLYDQTPPALRWLLGVLTAGLYFLARYIWKQRYERLLRLEALAEKTATTEDIKEINDNVNEVHKRVDKLLLHFGVKNND